MAIAAADGGLAFHACAEKALFIEQMEKIEKNEGIDPREDTSVYFNNIIRRDVSPIRSDELSSATVEEFSRQIRIAFPLETIRQ